MKPKLKLVKNGPGKSPTLRRSVKSAFKRALTKATEQEWDQVIIIGQGKNSGCWNHNPMTTIQILGMLEQAKYYILEIDQEE